MDRDREGGRKTEAETQSIIVTYVTNIPVGLPAVDARSSKSPCAVTP